MCIRDSLENVGIGNGHSLKRFSRATLQSQGTSSFDPSDDAAILTEPISVDPFMVTGLSWSGESALSANTQMFIRVRENGQWSQWYLTDKDGGAGKDRADGTEAVSYTHLDVYKRQHKHNDQKSTDHEEYRDQEDRG